MRLIGWLLWCCMVPALAQERTLDDFEQTGQWKAVVSDGVKASLQAAPGWRGQGLRFDYDFDGKGGYAAARRALPLTFGDDYAVSFWIRAEAPLNNFELKLVDPSGDNVWWVSRPNFQISREWQKITFKKRHFSFAWGPASDKVLRSTASLELVVSAGREGGRGSLFIDQLSLRDIAPAGPLPEPVHSAWARDAEGRHAMTVDFGRAREFGGLVLEWAEGAHASDYDIALSDDGKNWRTVRSVRGARGGSNPLMLNESETRYLRLQALAGPADGVRLARLAVRDLAFGESANAFLQALAKEAPRGHYPRGMSGEQNYWTVVGVDGGRETGLLSEDGALEVARAGFTIEPFVVEDGKLTTWADVTVTQSLKEQYLPIPSVHWQGRGWQLDSTAFARGTAASSHLLARYQLTNSSGQPKKLRLLLALRPLQVNPPMQFLNTPPGVSPIHRLAFDGSAFSVDGKRRVQVLDKPAAAGVTSFDAGGLLPAAEGGVSVDDPTGFASGALAYDVTLAPGATKVIGLAMPLNGSGELPQQIALDSAQEEVAAFWRSRLNQVKLTVPPLGQPFIDTLRSSLAHMLMTRDGPILMPGTRSYARSWIRDGAMMSEAMLRLGNDDVARDYIKWYAPYQFDSGKIPCCVDRRGADPVPENDSQGEFIFLAAQLWHYTRDRALIESLWPRIAAAAGYMEQQRQSQRTPEQPAVLYGLLPASISHEGYSAKPMHSNWDNFWGLRGYRDAATLARVLGKDAQAAAYTSQANQFQRELMASLRLTAKQHGINYLAGAAELGDFDPTSTTIALSPGGLQDKLPQDLLKGTFARYWKESIARRDGMREWKDYTPYELRNVAAYVRLGWPARAYEMLTYFMRDRRPLAWNQWAEVVGREVREPRFVGDMPHGWISSDYIRSALDLFAYERESDHALVIADGIPPHWLGQGVAVEGLRTPYGALAYRMQDKADRITITIPAGLTVPPGGLVVRSNWPSWGAATINGKRANWRRGELRVMSLPATINIQQKADR